MRALIVANGDMPAHELVRQLAEEAEFVLAADGGGDRAIAAGVVPELVAGDLDSLSDAAREQLGAARLRRIADPETTDLEKVIAVALERGATTIVICGAGGGRADHALANLSVLVRFRGRAAISIIDDLFTIRLVDGETAIERPAGTVVSLVAIGRCEGVTTTGLRWPLENATLEFSPRGIHNEVAASVASVRAASGDLLLFEGRWVEKHG